MSSLRIGESDMRCLAGKQVLKVEQQSGLSGDGEEAGLSSTGMVWGVWEWFG